MPIPTQPRLALRFTQAISVLMTVCEIDPVARTAFEARIRQLQRLGVLRRDEARPAGPLDYGIVELAALATAVRLMAAFMVPSLAARYVAERWTTLAPILLAGARTSMPSDYLSRRPVGDAAILLIKASALTDLGRQGRHDERYAGALGEIIGISSETLAGSVGAFGGAGIVLDTASFMPGIIEGYSRATMATKDDLEHELDTVRFTA